MRKILLLIAASLALVGATPAVAQIGPGGEVVAGQVALDSSLQTKAAATLYVDWTLGKDSNRCLATGAGACKTIQGAVDKVPKRLRHGITISIATGYAGTGAYIDGFSCEPGSSSATGAYLQIVGALANVTPASGAATGTATSGAAQSGNAFGTITNSGEAWTANDFRRKLLRISAGTGSGQIAAIDGNTATAITIAGSWPIATPTSSSVYNVQLPSVTVTSALTLPASPMATEDGSQGNAVTNYAAFIVGGIRASEVAPGPSTTTTASQVAVMPCVMIDKLAYTGRGIVVRNSVGVAARFSQFQSTSQPAVTAFDGSRVQLVSNVTGIYASGIPFYSGGSADVTSASYLWGNVGQGGKAMDGFDGAGAVGTGVGGVVATRNNSWYSGDTGSSATGVFNLAGAGNRISLVNDHVNSAVFGPCVMVIGQSSFGSGSAEVFFQNSVYSSCASNGIELRGNVVAASSGGITGASNGQFGLALGQGARYRFSTSDTITGTSGDIQQDARTVTWANLATLNTAGVGLTSATGSHIGPAGAPGTYDSYEMVYPAATQAAGNCTVSNKGSLYLDTTTNNVKVCDNNAAWKALPRQTGSGTLVIDFASTSSTCVLSAAVTVTGAALGDSCTLGISADLSAINGDFSCVVTAADTAKVKFCAGAATQDPASATYTVRTYN